MNSTLIIATHNPGKLLAMKKVLANLGCEMKAITEFSSIEPEETGTTFEENALIKARAAYLITGMPSISDDSGLCIDTLNGAPGVYAANLATEEDGTRNYLKAFESLKDQVGEGDKTARFVGVMAYVDAQGEKLFRAETVGRVDFSSYDHKDTATFGYDPIFIPVGDTRTFAQMGAEEKATYSHRTKALMLFKAWFKDYLLTERGTGHGI